VVHGYLYSHLHFEKLRLAAYLQQDPPPVPDELGYATRVLKRALEGKGHVKRVRGVKGIPDFIVTFESHKNITIFLELKHGNTKLHTLQAATLDELYYMGAVAVLLNLLDDDTWAIYFPPFLDNHKRLRCLKNPDTVTPELDAVALLTRIKGRTQNERLGEQRGRG
jgi:hypothetical protein